VRKPRDAKPLTTAEYLALIDARLRDPATNAAQFTRLQARREKLTNARLSGQPTEPLSDHVLAEGLNGDQLRVLRMTEGANREIWRETFRIENETIKGGFDGGPENRL
jgi:hypothetical protein